MIEIGKINFNNKRNILNVTLVVLEDTDIQAVRRFVLEQHAKMERKDFFIIEDLDTELPLIFENDKGVVYGVMLDNKIIAIQAIDFSVENSVRLRYFIHSFLKNDYPIYEMGWTMVASEFRGYHIAEYLVSYIENSIKEQNCILSATVHPENIKALALYMKRGYRGYAIAEYYGYNRMFLIKMPLSGKVISKVCVECSKLKEIQDTLCKQYFCENIVEKDDKGFMERILVK